MRGPLPVRRKLEMAYVMALASLALCVSLVACGGDDARKSAAAAQAPPSSVQSSATALARRTCRSMSPTEVIKRYLPEARRRAASVPLDRRFLKTAAHAPKALRESPAYPGIAGRVYSLSLPQSERQAALVACTTQLIAEEPSK
jgi:hypothetical protein